MQAVLLSVLEFDDDTCSAMELLRGPIADCERVANRIPAVTYSGDKTVVESYFKIVDAKEWDQWSQENAID